MNAIDWKAIGKYPTVLVSLNKSKTEHVNMCATNRDYCMASKLALTYPMFHLSSKYNKDHLILMKPYCRNKSTNVHTSKLLQHSVAKGGVRTGLV